jgi:hypothetical protein
MPEDFELSPSQRAALAEFIAAAGEPAFDSADAAGYTDAELLFAALLAAEAAGLSSAEIGGLFEERFEIDKASITQILELMSEVYTLRAVKAAGGGPN